MAKRRIPPGIRLRGVRQNNLKGFDLDLPYGRLIVVTGLSGSGKSSLAFDTLFAEGQRRYIETFSPYARQFFDRMDKPQADRIEGIPPAIAIEQRNAVRSTRSTVGTMTELCDYMKLLWPQVAQLHCRRCGQGVQPEPPPIIWQKLSADPEFAQAECLLTFDLPLSEKLSAAESLALIAKQGYRRLLVSEQVVRLEEAEPLLAGQTPPARCLTVIQDRLRLAPSNRARFIEACEQGYHFGKGKLTVHRWRPGDSPESGSKAPRFYRFSNRLHCAACDLDYREPTTALFSFNNPVGACPTCKGFGRVISIDYQLAIPDPGRTLAQGAVRPWQTGVSAECQDDLRKFCKARRVPMNVPFGELSLEHRRWVLEGDPDYGIDEAHQWPYAWYGVKGYFRWLESKAYKMHVRVLLSRYRAYTTCPECEGQRLQADALLYCLRVSEGAGRPPERGAVGASEAAGRGAGAESQPPAHERSHGESVSQLERSELPRPSSFLTLADFYALPIDSALAVVEHLIAQRPLERRDPLAVVLQEVRSRLSYLVEVGLGYLTLDRPTRTLSGGETERVNLTTCLGARLVNTLFVLDEPSVGLHPRDTGRLIEILKRLRNAGNTVVVVEHEPSVMRAADEIVDLGPRSGEQGGQLIVHGTFESLLRCRASLTGQFLSGAQRIELPRRRPVPLARDRPRTIAANAGAVASAGEGLVLHDATPREWGQGGEDERPSLSIRRATRHNLRDLDVDIPLGRFVCITGVSGSGKTTLVREVLLPAVQGRLHSPPAPAKPSDRLEVEEQPQGAGTSSDRPRFARVEGWEHLGQVVLVDQSPLGKTPRSNPVVYIGAFDEIRALFALSEGARQRGLSASAFSFNSAEGQCERCRGAGFEKIEMQFLSDVFIRCPDCNGRRYRPHILQVKLTLPGRSTPRRGQRRRGHTEANRLRAPSIADLLEATVDNAIEYLLNFLPEPPARRALPRLNLLREVGLGYLRLGQPINTLSGGESQRLKLASHLAEFFGQRQDPPSTPAEALEDEREKAIRDASAPPASASSKPTLFVFDEPTTGLHFDDVRVLLKVFQRLVDEGHSVLVIEHNLEVIKCADWVIDLGPEAGGGGGQVVVCGTPEDVARCEPSHTGRFLREVLDQ